MTRMRSHEAGPPSLVQPRGLSRCDAATYIGISPSLFDQMVKDGRMPPPKRVNRRTIWDRRSLDAAFDSLPEGDEGNPWDRIGTS
jgi:predicted DNA-binding transcriptional regulator AlpA